MAPVKTRKSSQNTVTMMLLRTRSLDKSVQISDKNKLNHRFLHSLKYFKQTKTKSQSSLKIPLYYHLSTYAKFSEKLTNGRVRILCMY